MAALLKVLIDPEMQLERSGVPSALGRPGLKTAVPVLTGALADDDPLVRLSAARALAAIGPEAAESIPALKLMARSSDRVEKRTARSSLMSLGESLPDLVDFFERTQDYYRRKLAKEPVKESSEALLDSSPWSTDGVFFVVDSSGSSVSGYRFAQRYIPGVLSTLAADSEFGVVFFHAGRVSYPPGGKPARAGGAERAAAQGFVLGIEPGAGSCPQGGFKAALDFAEASSAKRKRIVYIGDGGGTCMGASEAEYLERVCNEVTSRNNGGAEIHAIGVGAGKLGEAFLVYFTDQNGGTYTRLVTE